MLPLRRKSVFIILTNLLQNSLKYSKENTEVSVSIWRENSKTYLEVRDRGIGIEKDAQSQIFNPFFRENSQELGKIQGSGLGLSIVKKILDNMGGKIWVISQEGEGSTFFFRIPKNETNE